MDSWAATTVMRATLPSTAPQPSFCNGIDDNCDGVIDEGVTTTFFTDADADGFGDEHGSRGMRGGSIPGHQRSGL